MNLRTLIPPPALPTNQPPEPGDAARRLPHPGITPGRPAVVAFLRHTGCPFAEATVHVLRDGADREDRIDWIAVSHSEPIATERWLREIGGAGGVRVLLDTDRRLYASWGLGRSSLGHFMGRRSLSAVRSLAKDGVRNRHPHGTRWQRAGTFAVDASGIVRWRHLPAHAGELPDIEAAVAAGLSR
jgi:hypothetical protein